MTTNSYTHDEYRAKETEALPNDPLCLECGRTVDAWVVTFESTIHDDTGYSKLHRCPHCDALCFDDQYSNLGCLIFWLSFFPMCILAVGLIASVTGKINVGEDGVQGTDALRMGIGLVAGGFGAWFVSTAVGSLRRSRLQRRMQKIINESD